MNQSDSQQLTNLDINTKLRSDLDKFFQRTYSSKDLLHEVQPYLDEAQVNKIKGFVLDFIMEGYENINSNINQQHGRFDLMLVKSNGYKVIIDWKYSNKEHADLINQQRYIEKFQKYAKEANCELYVYQMNTGQYSQFNKLYNKFTNELLDMPEQTVDQQLELSGEKIFQAGTNKMFSPFNDISIKKVYKKLLKEKNKLRFILDSTRTEKYKYSLQCEESFISIRYHHHLVEKKIKQNGRQNE